MSIDIGLLTEEELHKLAMDLQKIGIVKQVRALDIHRKKDSLSIALENNSINGDVNYDLKKSIFKIADICTKNKKEGCTSYSQTIQSSVLDKYNTIIEEIVKAILPYRDNWLKEKKKDTALQETARDIEDERIEDILLNARKEFLRKYCDKQDIEIIEDKHTITYSDIYVRFYKDGIVTVEKYRVTGKVGKMKIMRIV